jgi:hypothetical protein
MQLLSLAMFAAILWIAIAAIVATIRAELPYIARALGGDGAVLPPLQSTRAPRVRVTRQQLASGRRSLRAAA